MHDRRWMLVPSFALAVAAYYAVYVVSPDVLLLKANAALGSIEQTFQVQYRDITLQPRNVPEPVPVEDLTAAPETIRELMDETLGPIPVELTPSEPVETLNVEERLAQETLEREHDLAFPPPALDSIEADILSISERSARENIEVARRLVEPVDTRLLAEGETPGLGAGISAPAALPPPEPMVVAKAEEADEPAPAEDPKPEPLEALEPEAPPIERVALAPMEPPAPSFDALEVETNIIEQVARQEVRGGGSDFENMDRLVRLEVATHVDADGGYFRLRFVPIESAEMPSLPKEVTFVIDASRSIAQRKLDQTARGVQECLELLNESDRFNIVVFRDTPRFFREEPVEVSFVNIKAASEFLANLESIGSTDVYNAVYPLLQRPSAPGVPSVILFASDGRPTGDNLAGRALINALTAENQHRIPIYTIGGGQTVNRYLLDLLAYRNKGVTRLVDDIDDIGGAVPQFFQRFSDAILVQPRADFGSVPRDQIFPREIPDFYRGQVVTLYGRFDPAQHDRLVVRLLGNTTDARKEIILTASLSGAEAGGERIAQEWAFQKSYSLIGEMTRVGETPELTAELSALSQKYGVRTAYTQ